MIFFLTDTGLPFGPAAAGLEQHPPKPRLMFKMPRVVANQKEKFETDDLMKRHSREGEVSACRKRQTPKHDTSVLKGSHN